VRCQDLQLRRFRPRDIALALPCLWASVDPSAVIAIPGQPAPGQAGNTNLTTFVDDGLLETGRPYRHGEVQRVNDGLRERGRAALIAYLCALGRVPLPWGASATSAPDLSDLLLLDVQTGLCEKASRIEEAIAAVQNFVRRARLFLEQQWPVTRGFALLWDRQFATFHIWEVCKRRQLYRENWIEWSELERARRIEAFRLLESELRSSSLSVAEADAFEWWPDERPPELGASGFPLRSAVGRRRCAAHGDRAAEPTAV
jgi:hypothetical protein